MVGADGCDLEGGFLFESDSFWDVLANVKQPKLVNLEDSLGPSLKTIFCFP